MACPRFEPAVIAVDGKVYAFGGDTSNLTAAEPPFYCYEEVFDTILERWESIPEPPSINVTTLLPPQVSPSLAVITDLRGIKKGILVHVSDDCMLYVYYVDSRRWVVFDSSFGDIPRHFAAVNGVLFCFFAKESALLGYDLISKTWKPVEFPARDFPDRVSADTPGLFHLGKGNLCFLRKEYEYARVRYVRFTVEDDGTRFLGTVTHLGSLALEMPSSPSTRTLD